jgi:GNAT superfamily N-acetyltransferase
MTIRLAHPDDEDWLMRMTRRLADFDLPGWRTADEIAQADRPILRDALRGLTQGAVILVAELDADGTRAGYVFATTKHDYFTHAPHAHVEVLVVEPGAEGHGVARSLIEAVEAWARDCGYGQVTLNVFDTNSRARGLYTKLGYQPETLHYRKEV